MAYYNVCSNCGAYLDPGEKCDCEDEKQKKKDMFAGLIRVNPKTGQMAFCIGEEKAYVEKTAC